MKLKVKENLYIREIEGEKVVYDEENTRVHFMNGTAAFIFELCDGTHSKEEIIKNLLDKYEVTIEKAEMDVKKVLNDLAENKILS